nr:right-handed parallel beta-helix repeat-containing protein [uncultured Desulfobacter sp.]
MPSQYLIARCVEKKDLRWFYSCAILIAIFFLISSKLAKSEEFYVDNKSGKDSNSGLIDRPFKSISKAMAAIKAGDTLTIISNGEDTPYWEAIQLNQSGLSGAYITIQGESENKKPIFLGNDSGSTLQCYGKKFIRVRNIIFKNSKYSTLGFSNVKNIILTGLEIYGTRKNAILVTDGGTNFQVINCIIRNVDNSGIAFMGSKFEKLSHTLVDGCTISDVLTNDGITLHKQDGYNVGSDHIISNNKISHCREQGIDITSGTKVLIENNYTFSNHDSGILIDHNASDVEIINHRSKNEKLYGLIINDSKNVVVENSSFFGAVKKTILRIKGCENLVMENNVFKSTEGSAHRYLVDICDSDTAVTNNLTFRCNQFLVSKGNLSSSMMLRYLKIIPEEIVIKWENNIWYNYENDKKVFFDANNGKYDFDKFKNKYAPSDSFVNPENDDNI